MAAKAAKPATVEAYLDTVPPAQREALEKLRKGIARVVPGATQDIWYSMPTFKLDGRPLVCLRAGSRHCALYVMSPKLLAAHKKLLEGLDWSGGTVRFTPDEPLPAAVVRTLVKARAEEVAGGAKMRTRP